MKKLEKNIKLDYVYRFISSVDITSAIWVLYLSYRGFSLIQIGLAEGIFHAAKFILEIPTGAVADIWGRKRSLVASRGLAFLSSLIMIFGNGFGEIALGFIISAASLSLNSGSEEALVYDSLKTLGKEEQYIRVNGILNFLIEVAQIFAVFIGGVLSDISFTLSYGIAAIISLTSLLISLGFYESTKSNLNEKHNIKTHFRECFNIIKNEKQIMKIMLYFALIFAVDTTSHFYMQEYLNTMLFSMLMIGIFPLVGFAAQHLSMGLTFMVLGFILIVEVIVAFYYNKSRIK